ncbi:hypothetical protein Tco_0174863 [Tanacetum coccineum]
MEGLIESTIKRSRFRIMETIHVTFDEMHQVNGPGNQPMIITQKAWDKIILWDNMLQFPLVQYLPKKTVSIRCYGRGHQNFIANVATKNMNIYQDGCKNSFSVNGDLQEEVFVKIWEYGFSGPVDTTNGVRLKLDEDYGIPVEPTGFRGNGGLPNVPYSQSDYRPLLTKESFCSSDKPRQPSSAYALCGIVTQTIVDHAELVMEEFTQGIQNSFSHKANKLPSESLEKGSLLSKLVDEDDDAQQESFLKKKLSLDPAYLHKVGHCWRVSNGLGIRVSEATPKLHEVVGKGKAVVTEEQVAHSLIDLSKKKRTTDQFILVRRDQTPPDSTTGPSSRPDDDTSEKVIHESSSTSDSERTESDTETAAPKGDKDQDEVDTSTVTSGVSIPVSDPEKAHEALAGPDPEPMNEDQTGSDSGKLHVSLAGPNPEHMDDEFLSTAYPKVHENLKLITDERVFDDKPESHSGSMSSMKNLDDTFNFGDQFLYDKPTEDDQEKSKVREEPDSTIPDPNQTVTSTPPVIAPFTDVSSSKPSLLVTPPPINTEATTITTSLPEITPFIALQLRVARLEQEMSEVLERHTADLIEKYSVLPGPESVKNQESKKSLKEIIKAKKEQEEEKQDSTYSIRSTDKVDIEEFDLKSALFSHMNKKKSANKNTTNYRLYHALMEALIADEDVMDKEVADKVKDHKRKHDSDDDCNTPIKSQRSGIPLGVLLHSSYAQVTKKRLQKRCLKKCTFD